MDELPGVDLTGDDYVIKQKLFRNKYRIYDDSGALLLQTKQKLFRMKEEFPFLDGDGNPVFRVKAKSMFDFAGDYTLTTPDGEVLAVLEKQFTFFKHVWRIRGPDGELYATIESGSTFVEVLRNVSGIFGLIPHSYTIEAPDGTTLGSLKGRLSVRDTYDLHLGDVGDAPKEALVAAAVAIDALEGN
ncbi:LURP-one-related/scramblase family protein [Natronomonas sp. EA1]|uniref:LURP-one-related/scramblase family protein n=1 Tax=Natronomonas sp. EA1 TaxID=3421655 RepID=UPI003EBC8D22